MTTTPQTATEEAKTDLPEHFTARVVGQVQHRVGDGPLEYLPIGQEVQVDMALASMVVSWTSEGQPVTVTLARDEFLLHVSEGSIQVQR